MIQAAIIAKIIGIIIVGAIAAYTTQTFLLPSSNTNNATNIVVLTNNSSTSLDDVTKTAGEFPLQSFIDMITAGVWDVASWFGKMLTSAMSYMIKLFTGMDVIFPTWVGLLLFTLFILILIWSQWNTVWQFIMNNIIFSIIAIIIVVIIAVILSMLGVV